MFFNNDILYTNAPLAIVWAAGNDDLRFRGIKGRRNKLFQRLLDSNINALCVQIRGQFPTMGTTKGLNLKKMAILMKGLTFIYLTKLDHLAKNLSDLHLRLHVSMAGRLHKIDLPTTNRPSLGINGIAPLEVLPLTVGFGELMEMNDLDFPEFQLQADMDISSSPRMRDLDAFPQLIMSPPQSSTGDQNKTVRREKQKRKRRGEGHTETLNEDNVLNIFQDAISRNQNAHCLVEDDGILEKRPADMDFFGDNPDMNFFDEDQPLLQAMEPAAMDFEETTNEPPILETICREDGYSSPPGRLSTVAENIRSRRGTQASSSSDDEGMTQNRNRNLINLELGDLESQGVILAHRNRRRSKRLRIDSEIIIDSDEMNKRLRVQKKPLDYDELRVILIDQRAPIGKHAKRIKFAGLPMIENAGRKGTGRQLSNFLETLKMDRPEQRRSADVSSRRDDISVRGLRAERTDRGNSNVFDDLSIQPINNLPDISEDQEQINEVVDPEQPIDFPMIDNNAYNEVQEENADINENIHSSQRSSRRGRDIADEINNLQEGQTTFGIMFPSDQVSKRHAASGFFQLLRLKAAAKVELIQEETYGEILVTRI